MTYFCTGKIDSLWVNPYRTRLTVNGRTYEIIKEGEQYFLVTLSGVKYHLRNFSIDDKVFVILVDDDLTEYFTMCYSVDSSHS